MSNDIMSPDEGSKRERMARERRKRIWRKVWLAARPFIAIAIAVLVCYKIVDLGIAFVRENFTDPVDINDATPIVVTVPSGYGASGIAKLLYEACGEGEEGVIKSKAVFKVYVDFTGKSNKLKAGTYVFSKNMDVEQIVDVICKGNPPKETVRFTITEGMSVEEIAEKLYSLGILKEKNTFLDLCRTGEGFDYAFLTAIVSNEKQARDYKLEGYLFPDTYEVYTDTTEKTIINRMLKRFFDVFSDELIARAQELEMSIDDVVNLASLIEKEAKLETDFAKVSAVFHNRLKTDMTLGSDAPLKYIFKTNTLSFTADQLRSQSLYNTHVYKGLPLGPITNPGLNAINAALNPDQTYLDEQYLYFCLKDAETGELAYAKTIEEHDANVANYSSQWKSE